MENIEITSVNNELVKEVAKLSQKKYRDESKKFLLEGFKAIEEAFNSGIEIEQVFVLKECLGKYGFLKSVISTTEPVLKKISTTDSAPEAVAVAKQKIFTLADLKNAKKVVLLENIKDAGNLGTILRTAAAFSQDAVVLYGDTVDLYNPKCVRSAVGNLWKIPVVQIKDFDVLKNAFASYECVATLPCAKDTISLKEYSANLRLSNTPHPNPAPSRGEGEPLSPYLIMFGSEADGLSEELIDFATKKVTIEMSDKVESLNLSVSVGVVLHNIS